MAARVGDLRHPLAAIAGAPPARAGGTPPGGPGPETRLWLQEAGLPVLWHIASESIAYGWYRTACGWELSLTDAERVWPARGGEPGPPVAARCGSCIQMDQIAAQLTVGFDSDARGGPRTGR